ncbi:hypothetical protein D9756_006506 [Leucocoprinus leucothites]|uniref:DUF6534 domain-containing protein n=1 Tax=Leucocoprinus leucothites TaxID=201217 RepID=A0A8H5G276_9AGAR|nr:hypothetical protein D9756_006506 [Leucoagaricus leucothites]
MGEYDLTLGVQLVGIFFNTYLFGIVTIQFIHYFERDFKDPWWIRLAVVVLLVTDVFHSAAILYMAWEYFVRNFNNPSIIAVALWPYTFTPIATGLAAIVTHSFLSYRIYRLNKQQWLFIIFLILALASFSTGVASGIRAWIIVDMTKLNALNTLVTWWLTLQMVVDTSIAVVMAYTLWRSKTGYRKTDSVIHRLIRGAIQTGVFSTIFAAGDLICFICSPKTQLYDPDAHAKHERGFARDAGRDSRADNGSLHRLKGLKAYKSEFKTQLPHKWIQRVIYVLNVPEDPFRKVKPMSISSSQYPKSDQQLQK